MKVLLINKFLHPAGGAETYLFQTGKYLETQGCETEYFGMYDAANMAGNHWGIYTDAVDFHKKNLLAFAFKPLKIIYSKEARKKMKRLLDVFQPDIVHINNFNYQLTPSILLAADEYRREGHEKLRIVYTAHDPQLVCPNHYLYIPGTEQICEKCLNGSYDNCIRNRCIHNSVAKSCLGTMEAVFWKKKKVYDLIDLIICPSAFMKKKLDTDPLLAGKTVILRNFVRPVSAGSERKKGKYVLYFGRYSEEKGVRTLLQACRQLPEIPFVFAGGGPLEHLLQGIENVTNAGFLKGEELDRVISDARFVVCPSVCNENCPFSVIESMMHGVPVLGADRGGIPELIENGKTGWIFQAGNSEMLYRRIREIWDSSEPEEFGKMCGKVHFDSLEEYGAKLLELYATIERMG